MALSFKVAASLVAAVLLLATPQEARGWALEDDQAMPDDMVPVQKVAAIPGGGGAAGTILAGLSNVCLQCRCCSKSNPGTCVTTKCCSNFKCDPSGKCTLVVEKCDCRGCGGAN